MYLDIKRKALVNPPAGVRWQFLCLWWCPSLAHGTTPLSGYSQQLSMMLLEWVGGDLKNKGIGLDYYLEKYYEKMSNAEKYKLLRKPVHTPWARISKLDVIWISYVIIHLTFTLEFNTGYLLKVSSSASTNFISTSNLSFALVTLVHSSWP